MALIVQKFGGTSVADIEKIKHIATLVKKEYENGNKIAVVVSAMAGVTDQLVQYVNEISDLKTQNELAEYDSIVASGEQVTSGLLALELIKLGLNARSWLGWQVKISTSDIHSKARIEEIDAKKLANSINDGSIAVIAGFQGIYNYSSRITTLGRGGSDTTAVAIAAAINADRCDIYTDVDGVYTTDPRIVKKAKKLNEISYDEMLELASLGAKVLQTRSVEIAKKYRVPVQVLSSFSKKPGTIVVDEDKIMEQRHITGIAYNRNEVRITIEDIEFIPNIAANIFSPLSQANISIDMIVQNIAKNNKTDITFTLAKSDAKLAIEIIEKLKKTINYKKVTIDENVAKVSVVGVGIRGNSTIAETMFKVLAEKSINIYVITTSEIKISILIPDEYTELAVRALHSAYGLDE